MSLVILAINNRKHRCERNKNKTSSVFIPMGEKVNEISLLYWIDSVQSKFLSLIFAMYT